jgi:hypothetical protein
MMIKKINKVPYILERERRRRRGRRYVIGCRPARSLPMRSLQITKAID